MKFRIHYRAEFFYEEPVSLSPHVLRIFPKADQFLRVLETQFTPPADADCQFRRDLYDNHVACLFFPSLTDRVPVELVSVVETPARNPFHFLLDSRGLRIPFQYDDLERQILEPYMKFDGSATLPEELHPRVAVPTVEALVTFNQWMHQEIAYERREEGDPYPPAETLARRSASCRDFSVLMLEVLRRNGVAARLASGYLWEGDAANDKHVAEGAMHAWVEAYLPGPGWVGMDPTNGVFCDHHAITTAVGLTHAQIAPLTGFYYGKKTIPSRLETFLRVEEMRQSQQQ
jgi:transglutaminase-like putative cysteine protease